MDCRFPRGVFPKYVATHKGFLLSCKDWFWASALALALPLFLPLALPLPLLLALALLLPLALALAQPSQPSQPSLQDVDSWQLTFFVKALRESKKHVRRALWNIKIIKKQYENKEKSHTWKSSKSIRPMTLQNDEFQVSQNMLKNNRNTTKTHILDPPKQQKYQY